MDEKQMNELREAVIKEFADDPTCIRSYAHSALCTELSATYRKKNAAYGGSFQKAYQKYGPITALTRMSDKWSRIESLMMNPSLDDNGESLKDSLLDLANYCLMTVVEMLLKSHEAEKTQK